MEAEGGLRNCGVVPSPRGSGAGAWGGVGGMCLCPGSEGRGSGQTLASSGREVAREGDRTASGTQKPGRSAVPWEGQRPELGILKPGFHPCLATH
jgi:hypothetical protein